VLQVGAGERPVERSGGLAVVLAEAQLPIGELIQRVEAVGAERLALDDREVERSELADVLRERSDGKLQLDPQA
jgi:hypothetical protein